LGDNSCYLN
jgi:membrane-bound ClpP family serine protease